MFVSKQDLNKEKAVAGFHKLRNHFLGLGWVEYGVSKDLMNLKIRNVRCLKKEMNDRKYRIQFLERRCKVQEKYKETWMTRKEFVYVNQRIDT